MAETETIAKMAEIISENILEFFRWEAVGPYNQNYDCRKDIHKPKDKKQAHKHPTDVVFCYLDPYTGKRVYLNTDLKSYGSGSITTATTRSALKSLAQAVECARISEEWKNRYCTYPEVADIRAMLFIYNHDANYKKQFFAHFREKKQIGTKKTVDIANVIKVESIGVSVNNYIHILDPDKVNLLSTIVSDVKKLAGTNKFPINDYNFFYPELTLHKQHLSSSSELSASIEILCSAYIIIHHGKVKKIKNKNKINIKGVKEGYLIYYNGKGESENEFIYFLDTLSKYQIFKEDEFIRIRFTNKNRNGDILSNFKKSIYTYSNMWEFDDEKIKQLLKIETSTIEEFATILSQIDIGWER